MTVLRDQLTIRPAEPGDLAAARGRGLGRALKLDGQWKDCVLVEHLLGDAGIIPAPEQPS